MMQNDTEINVPVIHIEGTSHDNHDEHRMDHIFSLCDSKKCRLHCYAMQAISLNSTIHAMRCLNDKGAITHECITPCDIGIIPSTVFQDDLLAMHKQYNKNRNKNRSRRNYEQSTTHRKFTHYFYSKSDLVGHPIQQFAQDMHLLDLMEQDEADIELLEGLFRYNMINTYNDTFILIGDNWKNSSVAGKRDTQTKMSHTFGVLFHANETVTKYTTLSGRTVMHYITGKLDITNKDSNIVMLNDFSRNRVAAIASGSTQSLDCDLNLPSFISSFHGVNIYDLFKYHYEECTDKYSTEQERLLHASYLTLTQRSYFEVMSWITATSPPSYVYPVAYNSYIRQQCIPLHNAIPYEPDTYTEMIFKTVSEVATRSGIKFKYINQFIENFYNKETIPLMQPRAEIIHESQFNAINSTAIIEEMLRNNTRSNIMDIEKTLPIKPVITITVVTAANIISYILGFRIVQKIKRAMGISTFTATRYLLDSQYRKELRKEPRN